MVSATQRFKYQSKARLLSDLHNPPTCDIWIPGTSIRLPVQHSRFFLSHNISKSKLLCFSKPAPPEVMPRLGCWQLYPFSCSNQRPRRYADPLFLSEYSFYLSEEPVFWTPSRIYHQTLWAKHLHLIWLLPWLRPWTSVRYGCPLFKTTNWLPSHSGESQTFQTRQGFSAVAVESSGISFCSPIALSQLASWAPGFRKHRSF